MCSTYSESSQHAWECCAPSGALSICFAHILCFDRVGLALYQGLTFYDLPWPWLRLLKVTTYIGNSCNYMFFSCQNVFSYWPCYPVTMFQLHHPWHGSIVKLCTILCPIYSFQLGGSLLLGHILIFYIYVVITPLLEICKHAPIYWSDKCGLYLNIVGVSMPW